MELDKFKYVHIMSHESIVFNIQIIEMFNNNFNSEEHIFLVSNEDVYNQAKRV